MKIERCLFPIEETGHILGGVSRPFIYGLINKGESKTVKIVGRHLVLKSEIEKILESAK